MASFFFLHFMLSSYDLKMLYSQLQNSEDMENEIDEALQEYVILFKFRLNCHVSIWN